MTLKKLKEELSSREENSDYDTSLSLCNKIIDFYPNNKIGYVKKIEVLTNNYKRYLDKESINDLKQIYDKAYKFSNKKEKEVLSRKFNDYLDDISEVNNLNNQRKEIVSNLVTIKLNNYIIENINANINSLKRYSFSGKRITNIYDLINGIFYLAFMIVNLMYRNYLLFLTIPFGIFGIIVIYSFINMNLLKKEESLGEKSIFKATILNLENTINELKEEIDKKEKTLLSNILIKKDILLKIPTSFLENLSDVTDDNEEMVASNIIDKLSSNNIVLFTLMINEETNLNIDDILKKIDISKDEKNVFSKLFELKYFKNKIKQNKVIFTKKVKTFNYFVITLLLILSILSCIIALRTPSDIYLRGFIISLIIGFVTMFTYNINTGKHNVLSDTIGDNLIMTVFNSSLCYNLIYEANFNYLKFTYGFILVPLLFILTLIGFVSAISLLKYNNYISSLRKE